MVSTSRRVIEGFIGGSAFCFIAMNLEQYRHQQPVPYGVEHCKIHDIFCHPLSVLLPAGDMVQQVFTFSCAQINRNRTSGILYHFDFAI